MGEITLYLRIRDRTTTTIFLVAEKLAVEVLLGTTFTDELMFAILPDGWKVTVRDSNTVAIIEQGSMPANAVLTTKDTKKVTSKTLHETSNDSKKGEEQSTVVRAAKQLVLEPLSVTPVMVTTKARACYTLTLTSNVPSKGVCLP